MWNYRSTNSCMPNDRPVPQTSGRMMNTLSVRSMLDSTQIMWKPSVSGKQCISLGLALAIKSISFTVCLWLSSGPYGRMGQMSLLHLVRWVHTDSRWCVKPRSSKCCPSKGRAIPEIPLNPRQAEQSSWQSMDPRFDPFDWPGYSGTYVDCSFILCYKCTTSHCKVLPKDLQYLGYAIYGTYMSVWSKLSTSFSVSFTHVTWLHRLSFVCAM